MRWAAVILIAATFLTSLPMPAVYRPGLGAPTSGIPGGVELGYGMAIEHLPICMMGISWWANPLWLVGLILLARGGNKGPIFFGFAATLLAALVLVIGAFPPDHFEYSDLHRGYYVWLAASMAALPLTALVLAPEPRTPKVPDKYQEKALLEASGRGQP